MNRRIFASLAGIRGISARIYAASHPQSSLLVSPYRSSGHGDTGYSKVERKKTRPEATPEPGDTTWDRLELIPSFIRAGGNAGDQLGAFQPHAGFRIGTEASLESGHNRHKRMMRISSTEHRRGSTPMAKAPSQFL